MDFTGAFLYHPLFSLVMLGFALWTLWSAVWWLRRDSLRLRLAADETGSTWLRRGFIGALALNWLWQCHYLRP